MGGKSDDRHMTAARLFMRRLGEAIAVHLGHVCIGHDRIERDSTLKKRQRVCGGSADCHLVTTGGQNRREHVAEEKFVVDQENFKAACGPSELRIRPRLAYEMHDVENVDCLAAYFRRSDDVVCATGNLNFERLFDHVDNLIDEQAHRFSANRDYENGMKAARAHGI